MKDKTNLILERQTWTVKLVALGRMHVRGIHAQRETLNEARVNKILASFDPDKFEPPTLSEHGTMYYIIDGQHRVEAMRRWQGTGHEIQQITCRVYTGLKEKQEAEMFLILSDKLAISAMDRFRVAVNAERPEEVEIKKTVEAQELRVSRDGEDKSVSAVTALRRVYRSGGADALGKTLRIIRDSYPGIAFESLLIDGLGQVCQRYNGVINEHAMVKALNDIKGGVTTLRNRAEVLRKSTGVSKAQCIAAAAIDILRSTKGGSKIPSWWKMKDGDDKQAN